MIFGDHVRLAPDAEPAAWLTDTVSVERWRVGGLLPPFERYLEVAAASADAEDWWGAQREIVATIAEVAARFTDTPDRTWFAIWEGHGFATDTLRDVPSVDLPHRRYLLLSGAVTDVVHLRWPGDPDRWFRPDLWWPDDRQWFVATDVDFWRTYVGGSQALCDAIAARLPDLCRPVTADEPLPVED